MGAHPTRRQFIQSSAALTLAAFVAEISPSHAVFARQDDATPFADLSLPELNVDITDTSFTLDASRIPAGRYRLSVTVNTAYDDIPGAIFVALKDGLTFDQVHADLTNQDAEGPPAWYFTAWSAGGLLNWGEPGTTVYGIIDLPPGDYAVHATMAPNAGLKPVSLTVTGMMPADLPAIAADSRMTLVEGAITQDTPWAAGAQTLEIANAGKEMHNFSIFQIPNGSTLKDVELLSTAAETGTPQATNLDWDMITPYAQNVWQSPGTTMWMAVTFEPGTYLVRCFMYNEAEERIHAQLGEQAVYIVKTPRGDIPGFTPE
ncbi:MAG: hypothetical protein QM753_14585 [Thermomicrobiales bacterium]